jgi:site-specific recombinase XerD
MTTPLAIFDALEYLDKAVVVETEHKLINRQDFVYAAAFLKCYTGSVGTFNSYRREVERLLQWCQHISKMSIKELRREHIEEYIKFCQSPPLNWIGLSKVPRFLDKEGKRLANPAWRPFVATISKSAHRLGKTVATQDFNLSQGTLKELFAILSTFFNYLIQEEYLFVNPVALIRQKSKFIRKEQSQIIRRLSPLQWEYVISTITSLADEFPEKYERSLFILSALYAMYLRISELASSKRWTPKMGDFYQDYEGNWWFKTVGKGNKQRQIAVSNAMLEALKRYRRFLALSPLPHVSEATPILSKNKGKGPLCSTTYLREIIQECFDKACEKLKNDGFNIEAAALNAATVHWLRHTGISDDVKHRPREHVRDDAGHSSSATTDKYIDVELKERHKTARHKPLQETS